MKISKFSLAGLLLEEGEEDIAVLLVRSEIPEDLDTELEGERLTHIGLGPDVLQDFLPAVINRGDARPALSDRERALLEQTISHRWADLVSDWTHTMR